MILNRHKNSHENSVFVNNPGWTRKMKVKGRSLPPLNAKIFSESFVADSSFMQDSYMEDDQSNIMALKSLSQKVLLLKRSDSRCDKNSFEILYEKNEIGSEMTPTFRAQLDEDKKVNKNFIRSKLPEIHKGLIQVNSRFSGNLNKDHRLAAGGRLVKKIKIIQNKFPKDMFYK